MKSSIDKQLWYDFKNPFSYGLLCEGFRCSLYKMTMESDGIYVPVLIKRFLLVEEAADLMDIPAIVQAVALVKEGLAEFKSALREKISREQKMSQRELIRPSFATKFEKK